MASINERLTAALAAARADDKDQIKRGVTALPATATASGGGVSVQERLNAAMERAREEDRTTLLGARSVAAPSTATGQGVTTLPNFITPPTLGRAVGMDTLRSGAAASVLQRQAIAQANEQRREQAEFDAKYGDDSRLELGAKSVLTRTAYTLPMVGETIGQAAKNAATDWRNEEYQDKLNRARGLSGLLEGLGENDPQYAGKKAEYDALLAELEGMTTKMPLNENSFSMKGMKEANMLAGKALEGLDGAAGFLAKGALSIGQNVPVMAAAAVNPGLGALVAGAQSGADKAYEVQAEGGGAVEALARGTVSGGIEAFISKALPLKTWEEIVKGGGASLIRNILAQSGGEAVEEGATYVADYIADKAARDPNAKFSLSELAESAALGGLSGAFFGGAGTAVNRFTTLPMRNAQETAEAPSVPSQNGLEAAAGVSTLPMANTQQTASGGQKTASTGEAGEYRAEKPQNVEMPTVPIINLSMKDIPGVNEGELPRTGNTLRKDAISRARTRLKLDENSAAYIPASNVTRNGDEYVLKITKSSLDKMLSPTGGGPIGLESITVLDNIERIANNGVYFKSEGDRQNRDQIAGYDHLKTTVYIDNVPYEVDMRVRVYDEASGGENRLYYFTPEEIVTMKKIDANPLTGTLHERTMIQEAASTSTLIIAETPAGGNTQFAQNPGVETLPTVERPVEELPMVSDTGRSGMAAGASADTIAQAERISQAVGRKVLFYQAEGGENGYFDHDTQTIYVNAGSQNPVAQVIAHELTHSVEFTDAYQELSALVQTRMGQAGESLARLKQAKAEQYARRGQSLSDGDALREVVAEYVEKNLLTDERSITTLANERPSLARRILNLLDELLAKLGVKGAGERAFVARARDAYARALGQASTGYGMSTEESLRRIREAYARGEMSEAEFDDAFDAIMEDESERGQSMTEKGGRQYPIEELPGAQGTPGVLPTRQYSLETPQEGQSPAVEEPPGAQTPAETLPAKARDYLIRVENAMVRRLGDALSVPFAARQEHLKQMAREVSNEYLRSGAVSEETSDALFERAWSESGQAADKDWARWDFEDALGQMKSELRDVKRYAEDRARRTEERPVLTLEEVKALYPKMKDARRAYEKVQAKNLLTEADEAVVGQLMRGEKELSQLNPEENNMRGITAVYEAKQEYEALARQIREWNKTRKGELRQSADSFLETANAWKDKLHGILYSRETMERNIKDIVPDKALAKRVIDAYFTPVHKGVAEATRTKNAYRERVKALDLSREVSKAEAEQGKVSEAHAVQLLGEAQDSIQMLERSRGRMKVRDGKTLEDWQGIIQNLKAKNPQLDWNKIQGAVDEFRKIYDELFQQMNEARMRNGYEPVNYRSGYFPHFQPGDGDGILAQFGKALGMDTAVSALPASINGLTHSFKPGITWMGNAQERLGFNTVYDAVEGFDRYIEGVADVIHLTDCIQNLRALASQIRYRTTDKGIREQVDAVMADTTLSETDKQNRIEKLYENGKFTLSNFVVELEEYTNLLANKKSRADRNMERALGRDAYNKMKWLESRVAANMVAVNPASWLTNFIPITQGWSTVGSKHILRGMWDTLKAIKTDDGMVGRSTFLTNRQGSDPLVKTWAQGWSDNLSKPMTWIDSLTSATLVRGRYSQNLERGMSEAAAMDEADAWAAGVMADRSKGATPTLFNQSNPLTKAFTQFQLEVNNQFSYLFKDVPEDVKEKGLAFLAGSLLKFFVGAFLFNEVYEYFIGRRPALDPIGILNDTAGDFTGYELPNLVELGASAATGGELPSFRTEKTTPGQALANLGGNVIEELPFTAALSAVGIETDGGRIPVASAFPDLAAITTAVGNTEWAPEKRAKEVLEELAAPAFYILPPFGGGQVKKIAQGALAVAQGGSYSMDSEGRDLLQYPVYRDTPGQAAQSLAGAMLFGKTSLPEGREWVESGFKTLGYRETELYKNMMDAGMSGEEAYGMIRAIRTAEGQAGKLEVIAESELSEGEAKEFLGLVMGTELETENGNPTQYAKMLDALDTELTTREVVTLKNTGSSALDRFLGMDDAGVSTEGAYKAAMAMMKLEPQAGKDSVSNLQRCRAVLDAGLSERDELAALETLLGEKEFQRLEAGSTLGITPEEYISCRELLPKFDEDGNGGYKHSEITEAIRSISGLSTEKRAVLWQIVTGSTSAKSNPFSTAVGQRVCEALSLE